MNRKKGAYLPTPMYCEQPKGLIYYEKAEKTG